MEKTMKVGRKVYSYAYGRDGEIIASTVTPEGVLIYRVRLDADGVEVNCAADNVRPARRNEWQ